MIDNVTNIRAWFIDRASVLRKEPVNVRYRLVSQLIADGHAFGLRLEEDVFYAAYGDWAARLYWESHLSKPIAVGGLAYFLSVHLSLPADQLDYAKVAIILAFQEAVFAGEEWFIGDATPLLMFERESREFEAIAKVKVRPRAAIEWLLSKAQHRQFIPKSLEACISRQVPMPKKLRPMINKNAQAFVDQYIEQAMKSGKRPTLKGLEAAAKEAAFYGGREILRERFRRSCDVRRGRPPKIAKK